MAPKIRFKTQEEQCILIPLTFTDEENKKNGKGKTHNKQTNKHK